MILPVFRLAVEAEFLQEMLHVVAADADAVALLEKKLDVLGLVRRFLGRDAQDVHAARLFAARVKPRVFQDAALETYVQEVAIHRIRLLRRGGDGDVVLLRERDHLRAARELAAEPLLPPRRDDLQFRRQRRRRQFEANLVVALARGAVGHRVRLFLAGYLDHPLGDERAGDAGAEVILVLVKSVRLEHREDEVPGELLPQILDVTPRRAGVERLRFEAVEFLLLAHVRAKGDDLGGIRILQPAQEDGSIQPARIRDDDFHAPTRYSPRAILSTL